jgi:probable non-F420 flavinoid oxidoreductase
MTRSAIVERRAGSGTDPLFARHRIVTTFSYHASHEQFAPGELLQCVRAAEAAGFAGGFSSDHLQPWGRAQGQSGFAWSWLGAALQATSQLTFSLITVPGGWRYQPVVLAQAIATLAQMYEGRVPWVALGSGQAINERAVGRGWPAKNERNARLFDGAQVIKRLLAGETVSYRGTVSALDARIWSLPRKVPRLVAAAVSEETAEWLGSWADGLLTAGHDPDALARVVAAFRRGGGQGKPVHLKLGLSWAEEPAEALRQAHEQWRFNVLGGDISWELARPEDFEQATRFVRPQDMHQDLFISHDPDAHIARLKALADVGFETIVLHNVGRNQEQFIRTFGERVLPRVDGTREPRPR